MHDKHDTHSHHGHHHEPPDLTHLNAAFIWGITLNLGYVLVQVVVGFRINSLSLLSDAGHNFLDVAGLTLAMLAFRLGKSRSTAQYTYGYRKASILISLLNAVVLLLSIGAIAYEAALRFRFPQPLPGKTIAILALIGIFINGISAFLFFRDREKDINIKTAFLHLAADALVSLALVAGGLIIAYTQLYWIDPLLSILICMVIIASTWNLLRKSLRLSLDGVPENVQPDQISKAILNVPGVEALHHLHIWAISTTRNALTAHIVVAASTSMAQADAIKATIKHILAHLHVQHATLEIETSTHPCADEDC